MATVELLAGQPKENETRRAILACNDYLRMGPGRSLVKLQQMYSESAAEKPPTKTLRTLFDWSRFFNWQARVADYDAAVELQKTALVEQRRREALETGLALDYERVFEIKDLYQRVKDDLDEKGLYYTDRKISAKGDVVDVEIFNSALLAALRGLLDDAAKETGGRKANASVTNLNVDLSTLTDAQLQRIAAGEDPTQVLASTTESGG